MKFQKSADWFVYESGPAIGGYCSTSGYGDTEDGIEHQQRPLPVLVIDAGSIFADGDSGRVWGRSEGELVELRDLSGDETEESVIGTRQYIEVREGDMWAKYGDNYLYWQSDRSAEEIEY